jgi:transcriptional regulator with XRE-family HTH domain
MSKNTTLSTIGKQIDTIREEHGLSLYQVAKNAGMDYAQLYRTMRLKTQPARDSLLRICRAMGCSSQEVVDIFNETNYKTPTSDELEEDHPKRKYKKAVAA